MTDRPRYAIFCRCGNKAIAAGSYPDGWVETIVYSSQRHQLDERVLISCSLDCAAEHFPGLRAVYQRRLAFLEGDALAGVAPPAVDVRHAACDERAEQLGRHVEELRAELAEERLQRELIGNQLAELDTVDIRMALDKHRNCSHSFCAVVHRRLSRMAALAHAQRKAAPPDQSGTASVEADALRGPSTLLPTEVF